MSVATDMLPVLDVRVNGLPRPQGSLTPIVNRKTFHVYMKSPDTLHIWRNTIIDQVRAKLPDDWQPLTGPLAGQLNFYLPRPKRHFDRAGNLLPDAPLYVSASPDLDKLLRAVLDALTYAEAYKDDAQVSIERSEKTYCAVGQVPGVRVKLWPL